MWCCVCLCVKFCSFISFILFFIPTNFLGFFCTSQNLHQGQAEVLLKRWIYLHLYCVFQVYWGCDKSCHTHPNIHSHSGVRDDRLLTLLNAFAHQGFTFGGQFKDRCLVFNLARKMNRVISRILTDLSWKPTFWIIVTKLEYGLNVSVLLRTKRREPQPGFSCDTNRKLMQACKR